MKIRHLSGPKAGTTEHLENTVGRTLVAMGVAEAVPLPPYGSKGWLAAIQEIDALRTKADPADVVPPAANGIEWSATILGSGKVRVVKKIDGEVFWFDGPPTDCPANIREQFIQLLSVNPAANVEALDAAKRAQQAADTVAQNALTGVVNAVKVAVRFLKTYGSGWSTRAAGEVSSLPPAKAQELADAGIVQIIEETA